MAERRSDRYIDILKKIVHFYNNTRHSRIQSEPVNVTKENERKIMVANVLALP